MTRSFPTRRSSDLESRSCHAALPLRFGGCPGADDLGALDLVRDGVARDLQPEAAALAVVPMLDVPAARVVAVEHVVAPVGGDGGAGIGALFRGVAAVGELPDVARADRKCPRFNSRPLFPS